MISFQWEISRENEINYFFIELMNIKFYELNEHLLIEG